MLCGASVLTYSTSKNACFFSEAQTVCASLKFYTVIDFLFGVWGFFTTWKPMPIHLLFGIHESLIKLFISIFVFI